MSVKWYVSWMLGTLIVVPAVYFLTRKAYFQGSADSFVSIYKTWWKAQVNYIGSLTALSYACYVVVSLLARKIGRVEAAIHLAIWTIAPPLWFSFERYFFFDQLSEPAKIEALKEGQDYASKFWASVLAVMLAFMLGDIIKQGEDKAPDSKSPGQPASNISLRQDSGQG